MNARLLASVILVMSIRAVAQTSAPAAKPATSAPAATQPSPDQVLDDLLKPPSNAGRPMTMPSSGVGYDSTSGTGALTSAAPKVQLLREGTYIIDRVARLGRTPDGSQSELLFESDGRTLRDPPMVILPNTKLTAMEGAIASQNRDLKFRVTGMVTEYRGRNYILLEKVMVLAQDAQEF